jgi:translation initiation factor IF-3
MKKKEKLIMNTFIRYPEVRVLGDENQNYGVMRIDDALDKARDMGLDLIPVSYTHLTLPTM